MVRRAALLLILLAAACAGPPPPPQKPVDYDSMPAAFRRTYSEAEFERMMRGEVVVPESARARPPEPNLELEPALEPMGTPGETLRAFVLAYQHRRWDAMLGFVPEQYRDRLTVDQMRAQFKSPEIRAHMKQIAAALDRGDAIDENGGRATLRYGDRFEVQMLLEDEVWKIVDLD
jgi:hypothetical protein